MTCDDLANALGLSPATLQAAEGAAPSPIDQTWSIGTGVTAAGALTMTLSNTVESGGSSLIGGRSVGNTVAEIGSYGKVVGGLGVVVSGYQILDAAQSGNTQGVVFSSADAVAGVVAFIPGFDVGALGYFGIRIADDIATAAAQPSSLLERLLQYDASGCQ